MLNTVNGAAAAQFVHGLLEQSLALDELKVPPLPAVAVQVVRAGAEASTNAQHLSDIIHADRALSLYVLRIAACAAKRPATPIVSLSHAVTWLGFDEVANIAFTLALQVKMLDVPGQQRKARRLWRHALATALWARQLAQILGQHAGLCYMCGLLHSIGKLVALGAASELARRTSTTLDGRDYELLIESFHRDIAARVLGEWSLPPKMCSVLLHWEDLRQAGDMCLESNIVHVAQRLADHCFVVDTSCERDALITDPAFRNLGLRQEDTLALFESLDGVNAELDRYLAP